VVPVLFEDWAGTTVSLAPAIFPILKRLSPPPIPDGEAAIPDFYGWALFSGPVDGQMQVSSYIRGFRESLTGIAGSGGEALISLGTSIIGVQIITTLLLLEMHRFWLERE